MYSTAPSIGKTRVIGRPLGLLISDIRISPSAVGSAERLACSPPLDTMALELVVAWCVGTSGVVVCAAAAPDGVACVVWGTASSTLVGGTASTFLDPLGSTGGGEGSTTLRGSAGPPCARRDGVPLMLTST